MNELLNFILSNCSFLHNEFGCRIVDSETDGFNALLVFERDALRLRFVRDRGQFFADFQNSRRRANSRWYSFGIVRHLITGDIGGSDVLNEKNVLEMRSHFSNLLALFNDGNVNETERKLALLEHERGERLFGK